MEELASLSVDDDENENTDIKIKQETLSEPEDNMTDLDSISKTHLDII